MIPRTSDVGVIVGRFQVHRLHDAHRQLIDSVYNTHPQTVIVLGLSPVKVSHRNPLDFEARKQMLLADYPKATIFYLHDQQSDHVWSAHLDKLISHYINPPQTVMLYGGRDSFQRHYFGRYPVVVLEPDAYVSGTELRKTISRSVKSTEDFRAGVIWASANGYPKAFPTVDVAIYREIKAAPSINDGPSLPTDHHEWLVVRKPDEIGWRFCGGFVDPARDKSLELAAHREVGEEVGVEISAAKYVGSAIVDDWRYRGETDKIMTTLFIAQYLFGPIRPADDVVEAMWLRDADMERELVDEHKPLWALIREMGGRDGRA